MIFYLIIISYRKKNLYIYYYKNTLIQNLFQENKMIKILILLLSLTFAMNCSDKSEQSNVDEESNPKSKTSNKVADGTKAIEEVNFNAIVTTSLTMRSAPDVNAPKAKCYEATDDFSVDGKNGWECGSTNCLRETTALKKDTQVMVVAQTVNIEKVDKWENRWYEIIPPTCDMYEEKRVWVFGEFIKAN
jgi:hypothetical protein